MKLISITLNNYRQFYGKQEILFASSDKNLNITVLHGFNGSGKTAFLNAFIWCLYGETTPDLEEPEKLENERALSEAEIGKDIKASVSLSFNNKEFKYIVERSKIAHKTGSSEFTRLSPELKMWRVDSSGEAENASKFPQELIHQILPANLYPFFFFNGERLESLAKADSYEKVEQGIKTLLDVEIFERAVQHLRNNVSSELSKELKQYGTVELADALNKENELKESIEADIVERDDRKRNIAALETDIEQIEMEQGKLEKIKDLVKERALKKESLVTCEKRIKEISTDLSRFLSEDGYLSFAPKIFEKAALLVSKAREKGELPAKLKPQFVDDLISAKICICKRDLKPGSAEVDALEEWKKHTGLAALEESINQTNNALAPLNHRRENYFTEIDKLQARKSELLTERRSLNEALGHLNGQIGDPQYGEQAEDLAAKREDYINKKITLQITNKNLEESMKKKEEDLSKVQKGIAKLKVMDTKALLIQRQKNSVNEVSDALEQIYNILKEDVREDLDKQISEVWKGASVKNYTAKITDNYKLVLTKNVGGIEQPVYGASTGEKLVLALSFVGSLVRKAGTNLEKAQKEQDGGFNIVVGGEYPLVMDSPFGALEDDYRSTVANWIPKLAHQVVVMVSKTQWREEVEKAMRGRIGKEYVLELHTTKEKVDRDITISGKNYQYVVSTNDPCEQTIIREVK